MAGTNSGFNSAQFREAIRFAMQMGTPNKPSEKATFQWAANKEFATPDVSNRPYNWTATPVVENLHPDVQVLCAVEFSGSASGSGTEMGTFERTSAVLTLLDQEYEKVKGANRVLLGGNRYEIMFTAPPTGLFDVTVYSIHCQAIDES